MSDDLLAQFRKSSPVSTGDMAAAKAPAGYVAFGTKDRVQRLRIRSAMAPVQSPGYNFLLNVSYDGDYGTNFVLMYSILDVLVRGRNLQKIIYAIENGMADFIQEFDPEKWPAPTDANAAFIDSIEVKFNDNGASSRENTSTH